MMFTAPRSTIVGGSNPVFTTPGVYNASSARGIDPCLLEDPDSERFVFRFTVMKTRLMEATLFRASNNPSS